MNNFVPDLFERCLGQWKLIFEIISKMLLCKKRIASSCPSCKGFVLLISLSIIATFKLSSNSTAVAIGAVNVAPLMDPIHNLFHWIVVSDGRLMRRAVVIGLTGRKSLSVAILS